MRIPLQITARNFDLPETFREEIRKKAENLDKYYSQIMHCKFCDRNRIDFTSLF